MMSWPSPSGHRQPSRRTIIDTTDNRTARAILTALSTAREPLTLAAIATAVGARPTSPRFVDAWQTLAGHVRYSGEAPNGSRRENGTPTFALTNSGRHLAEAIETEVYS